MSTLPKPMRAFKLTNDLYSELRFPLLAQPKIDGIRTIIDSKLAVSNTLKPIRNIFVQELAKTGLYSGFDCELTCGSNFQDSSSGIMSTPGVEDFTLHVFDIWDRPQIIFKERLKNLEYKYLQQNDPRVKLIQTIRVQNPDELESFNALMLEQGYEGAMYRCPKSLYKFGRSTFNEHKLLKDKPFADTEAQVIGFIEQMENQNEQETDARGYAKRSSHQENKVGKGTLGAFIVQAPEWGTFNIGTGLGLTDSFRLEIWNNQAKYLHQMITFSYQKHGTKDKPRIPIFKSFRHPDDILVEL